MTISFLSRCATCVKVANTAVRCWHLPLFVTFIQFEPFALPSNSLCKADQDNVCSVTRDITDRSKTMSIITRSNKVRDVNTYLYLNFFYRICLACIVVILGVFVYLICICCTLCVFVVSYMYFLYLMCICFILCVFVLSYVHFLYLMCICCTMCVLIFLL